MTDPTEMVLSGGFAAAAGLFAVSAMIRRWARGPSGTVFPVEAGIGEEVDPYRMPAQPLTPPEIPAGRVRVGLFRPMDLWGVAFVFGVFGMLVLASVRMAGEATVQLDPMTLMVSIGFQFMMAGLVVGAVAWRADVRDWLGLRWEKWPWVFLIAPATVVGMWALFGGLQVSGYVEWMESLGVETVQDTVKLLQESSDPQVLGLMAFAAVVAAPLCEEIVFRGYFYPVLKKYSGIWPAAICSGLVFACAHGSLTALLPLWIFGMVLVFIYEKTGSIWAPIAVHFCFNGATVVVQILARFYNIPLEAAT